CSVRTPGIFFFGLNNNNADQAAAHAGFGARKSSNGFVPQDHMCGLLRRYEFNAFVSRSPQVNPFKQPFSPAEQDRRDSKVQFINEAFTKILLDRVRPAADPHVLSAGRLTCAVERLVNASCDEVERSAT